MTDWNPPMEVLANEGACSEDLRITMLRDICTLLLQVEESVIAAPTLSKPKP